MPETFNVSSQPKMESLIPQPAIITDPTLYNNIPGNTLIRDSHFQYYQVQPLDADDSKFHPRKSDTGIVTHIDDSGAETTLFMDHQPSSLSSDPNLFNRSRMVRSALPTSSSHSEDKNTTDNITMSSNTANAFLVGNATDNSEQILVPSNLDTFPFTLTVEPPTHNQ